MALFEGKTPAERNKMIAAALLPLLALIFVVRMFFGSSAPASSNSNPNPRRTPSARNRQVQSDLPQVVVDVPTRMTFTRTTFDGSEAGRNIFAYFVVARKPTVEPSVAPATPTPTPPLALNSLTPASVYAKTSGFKLQVSGDKFTGATRIYIDGQEMQTQFRGPQQLATDVPANSISNPGARVVTVRTPDNTLYSNNATLNVMQPPSPTHTFIGMIERPRSETALLKNSKGELVSVQRNDLVEGRFRVTTITERTVELVDKDLNIKHSLPYVEARSTGTFGRVPGSIQPPPPPPPTDEDEEP